MSISLATKGVICIPGAGAAPAPSNVIVRVAPVSSVVVIRVPVPDTKVRVAPLQSEIKVRTGEPTAVVRVSPVQANIKVRVENP